MPTIRQAHVRHAHAAPPVHEGTEQVVKIPRFLKAKSTKSFSPTAGTDGTFDEMGMRVKKLRIASGSGLFQRNARTPALGKWEMKLEDFVEIRTLHQGSTSTIKLVRAHKKYPERPHWNEDVLYVLKCVRKQAARRMDPANRSAERAMLASMSWSPFIANMVTAFASDEYLVHVLEAFPHGTLSTLLEGHYGGVGLAPELTAFYAANIALGIGFLHAHGIAHRALRPAHILLGANGYLAICDLSHARSVFAEERELEPKQGTMEYSAPEVREWDDGTGTYAEDWWSFGMIIYKMLAVISPFHAGGDERHIFWATNVPWGRQLKDIVWSLLDVDPDRRLGALDDREVFQHPWFANVDWNEMEACIYEAPYVPNEMTFWDPARNATMPFRFDRVPLHAPEGRNEGGSRAIA
ncbi:kinase-like protein [Dentipellis sp. KUC8613]|nr:kinase-like protein [Dentipellis sp. KUC8613]